MFWVDNDDIYHYSSDFIASETWLVKNSKLGNQGNTKTNFLTMLGSLDSHESVIYNSS